MSSFPTGDSPHSAPDAERGFRVESGTVVEGTNRGAAFGVPAGSRRTAVDGFRDEANGTVAHAGVHAAGVVTCRREHTVVLLSATGRIRRKNGKERVIALAVAVEPTSPAGIFGGPNVVVSGEFRTIFHGHKLAVPRGGALMRVPAGIDEPSLYVSTAGDAHGTFRHEDGVRKTVGNGGEVVAESIVFLDKCAANGRTTPVIPTPDVAETAVVANGSGRTGAAALVGFGRAQERVDRRFEEFAVATGVVGNLERRRLHRTVLFVIFNTFHNQSVLSAKFHVRHNRDAERVPDGVVAIIAVNFVVRVRPRSRHTVVDVMEVLNGKPQLF